VILRHTDTQQKSDKHQALASEKLILQEEACWSINKGKISGFVDEKPDEIRDGFTREKQAHMMTVA
jgi:hypothetical protein